MVLKILFLLSAVYVTAAPAPSSSLQISLPNQPSSPVSVDKAFVGLGIESASLADYSNKVSTQLVRNIQEKTRGDFYVRVGGTSLDNARYDDQQKQAVTHSPNQEGWNVPMGITLGQGYFHSFTEWDGSNVKFILDVPLHGSEHPAQDASKKFLQAGLNAIGPNLGAVELGNEPDLYLADQSDTEVKSGKWTPKQYDITWHDFAFNYLDSVKAKIQSSKPYQVLGLSGSPDDQWKLSNWFKNDGGYHFDYSLIQTVSMHYYQTSSPRAQLGGQIQTQLMNHGAIVDKMGRYKESIQYTINKGMTFVMGEVGSSYNLKDGDQQYNDYDLEAVLGSALWTVDWMLYAMSLGVARVSMQQGTGFAYAGWQPTKLSTKNSKNIDPKWQPQAVAAPYYGYLFVADFIGSAPEVKMQQIQLDGQNSNPIWIAYGAFENNKLQRVAIINLKQCSGSADCTETTISMQLPQGKTGATVDKMTGPNDLGTKAMGIDMAYAEKNWQWSGQGKSQAASSKVPSSHLQATVDNGKVTFPVRNSEAVLVTLT